MKKVLLISFILSTLGVDLISQTISNNLRNYPPGVIFEVFDLTQKGELDEDKQIALAQIIDQRNRELSQMINNRDSNENIYSKKKEFEDAIEALLSMQEKYNIYVAKTRENAKHKYTYSQFAIAIRYKEEIGLTQAQENSLMALIDELKQMKNEHYTSTGKPLDTRAFESGEISQILTRQQYIELLTIKNQNKAEAYAAKDWAEIEQRFLDNEMNKEEVINKLTNYYLARQRAYDMFEHDLIKQKDEIRYIYSLRPNALRLLQKARRSPENDTLNSNLGGN